MILQNINTSITKSGLNSHCFPWHPYGKMGLFKTELVILEDPFHILQNKPSMGGQQIILSSNCCDNFSPLLQKGYHRWLNFMQMLVCADKVHALYVHSLDPPLQFVMSLFLLVEKLRFCNCCKLQLDLA